MASGVLQTATDAANLAVHVRRNGGEADFHGGPARDAVGPHASKFSRGDHFDGVAHVAHADVANYAVFKVLHDAAHAFAAAELALYDAFTVADGGLVAHANLVFKPVIAVAVEQGGTANQALGVDGLRGNVELLDVVAPVCVVKAAHRCASGKDQFKAGSWGGVARTGVGTGNVADFHLQARQWQVCGAGLDCGLCWHVRHFAGLAVSVLGKVGRFSNQSRCGCKSGF